MSGILSVRVDFDERQRLLTLVATEGHHNVSDLIRSRLGLPPRGRRPDPLLEEYGAIDVTKMLQSVMQLAEQSLRQRRMLDKIARRLSVPYDVDDEWRDLPKGGVIDDTEPPIAHLAKPPSTPMPTGFQR